MSTRGNRAWRFDHPDFDRRVGDTGVSVRPSVGVSMVDEHASVRQSILLLLSTRPGERVMRPDYGCDLRRLVYSPNDETTAGLAVHYVTRALTRWESRVELVRVDANPNDADPGRLDIEVAYRLRTTREPGRVSYALELGGEVG